MSYVLWSVLRWVDTIYILELRTTKFFIKWLSILNIGYDKCIMHASKYVVRYVYIFELQYACLNVCPTICLYLEFMQFLNWNVHVWESTMWYVCIWSYVNWICFVPAWWYTMWYVYMWSLCHFELYCTCLIIYHLICLDLENMWVCTVIYMSDKIPCDTSLFGVLCHLKL